MSASGSAFAKLAALDCSAHIERKGKFAYLSWPWAVAKLREADETATWEVRRFDGVPYLRTDCGYFVEVAVTVQGVTLSQIHPVLNAQNRPIEAPTAFDINTSIQRCLVKAIALHGLGLYIYAGEDVPQASSEEPAEMSAAQMSALQTLRDAAGSGLDALKGAWSSLNARQREALRDELPALKAAAHAVQAVAA